MKAIKTLAILTALSANTVQADLRMSFFELTTKPEAQQAIADVGKLNLSTSIQTEDGTLAMFQATDKNKPNVNYIVEIYRDEKAYKTHIAAPHFKQFVEIAKTAVMARKAMAVDAQFLAEKQPIAVSGDNDFTVKLAEVIVKPEKNQEFKNIVLGEMLQSMQKEPNILLMYAATLKDKPNEWRFFEIYANDEAYQQHRQTSHFQAYLVQTTEMLETKKLLDLKGVNLMTKGILHP